MVTSRTSRLRFFVRDSAKTSRRRGRAVVALALVWAATSATGCRRWHDDAPLTVSVEQTARWVRNFNPFVPGAARWPTLGGIYEPLFVLNPVKSEHQPWLGESYEWTNDGRGLRVRVRSDVRWSDGEPFSAADVAFTFSLLKRYPELDVNSVASFLDSARASEPGVVEFAFSKIFVPGFSLLAHQPIVPQHIWSTVEAPSDFSNPSPVATGPFTEVREFDDDAYVLGRNPDYWQAGKPAVDALRMPAYADNATANRALVDGVVDWAGNFVPAIDRVFVSKDPSHRGYWYPSIGSMVFLYANTTHPVLHDPLVRKSLSLAIDRELIAKVAMFDYTSPADSSGLGDALAAWRSVQPDESESWVRLDITAANRILDEAGYERDTHGWRTTSSGTALEFEIFVVRGWSDWVTTARFIAAGMERIGVRVSTRLLDFSDWLTAMQKGQFDLGIGWSDQGATPYAMYRGLMDSRLVRPVGETAGTNWHRLGLDEVRSLLSDYEAEADREAQRRISAELQRAFERSVPAIPLFASPSWGAFNASRFRGFPTEKNPYAPLSPNLQPASLLVLTQIEPVSGGRD